MFELPPRIAETEECLQRPSFLIADVTVMHSVTTNATGSTATEIALGGPAARSEPSNPAAAIFTNFQGEEPSAGAQEAFYAYLFYWVFCTYKGIGVCTVLPPPRTPDSG
jgi:hypothetical protein